MKKNGTKRPYLNAERRSSGSITINNMALLIDKELGKIPLDAVSENSTFARLQEFVYGSTALTIHIDL